MPRRKAAATDTDRKAAEFIREWNRRAIERSGGVVICPDGQSIDAATREQIEIARQAGTPSPSSPATPTATRNCAHSSNPALPGVAHER